MTHGGNPSRTRHHCRPSTSGFTLLEVILAMLLSTALMASLWTAMDIYLRSFEKGRTEVEQSQVIRALFRQLESDLRRTLPEPPHETPPLVAHTSAGPGLPFGDVPPFLPPSDAGLPLEASLAASGGLAGELPSLVGTQAELWLRVDQPQASDLRLNPDDDPHLRAASRIGDLKTIRYYLADAEPAHSENHEPTAQHGSALVRREGEWLRWRPAGAQQGDSPSLAAASAAPPSLEEAHGPAGFGDRGIPDEGADPTVIVAREVSGVEFRYYDGLVWSNEWNSARRGRLPVAVEIVFALRAGDDREPLVAQDQPVDGDTLARPGRRRLLVCLPSGQPLQQSPRDNALQPLGPETSRPPFLERVP